RKASRPHPRWLAEVAPASTCRMNSMTCCVTSLVRSHGAWPLPLPDTDDADDVPCGRVRHRRWLWLTLGVHPLSEIVADDESARENGRTAGVARLFVPGLDEIAAVAPSAHAARIAGGAGLFLTTWGGLG